MWLICWQQHFCKNVQHEKNIIFSVTFCLYFSLIFSMSSLHEMCEILYSGKVTYLCISTYFSFVKGTTQIVMYEGKSENSFFYSCEKIIASCYFVMCWYLIPLLGFRHLQQCRRYSAGALSVKKWKSYWMSGQGKRCELLSNCFGH